MKNLENKERIDKIIEKYGQNDTILGVILIGSRGKGYQTNNSDIDLELVVTEQKFIELRDKGQHYIHTENYDIIYKSLKELEKCKKSDIDQDHWEYKNCPIISDRTGKLSLLISEIGIYDYSRRLERLKKYYYEFWFEITGAISCLRSKNMFCRRIHASQAVKSFLSLIYNINNEWTPRLKWILKELPLLEKKPPDLEEKIYSVVSEPTEAKLKELWKIIAVYLREESFSWVDQPEFLLE